MQPTIPTNGAPGLENSLVPVDNQRLDGGPPVDYVRPNPTLHHSSAHPDVSNHVQETPFNAAPTSADASSEQTSPPIITSALDAPPAHGVIQTPDDAPLPPPPHSQDVPSASPPSTEPPTTHPSNQLANTTTGTSATPASVEPVTTLPTPPPQPVHSVTHNNNGGPAKKTKKKRKKSKAKEIVDADAERENEVDDGEEKSRGPGPVPWATGDVERFLLNHMSEYQLECVGSLKKANAFYHSVTKDLLKTFGWACFFMYLVEQGAFLKPADSKWPILSIRTSHQSSPDASHEPAPPTASTPAITEESTAAIAENSATAAITGTPSPNTNWPNPITIAYVKSLDKKLLRQLKDDFYLGPGDNWSSEIYNICRPVSIVPLAVKVYNKLTMSPE